jgi:hypothetical protein
MKTKFRIISNIWGWTCTLVALVALVGCVPERVTWSPDGTRGAVLGGDGLYACDVSGKLSGLLVPAVKWVRWMPDSKRVVVTRQVELKTWKELVAAFPVEAAEAQKKADEVVKALQDFKPETGLNQYGWTLYYLRDEKPELIKAKLGSVWDSVTALTEQAFATQIYDLTASPAKPGPVLLWSQEGFMDLRVSSTGQAVAISRLKGHDMDESELQVVATDGSGVRMKTEAALYPDWSADGKTLYYMTPEREHGKAQLGSLVRRQLIDDKGLTAEKDLPPAEELVGIAYSPKLRLRVGKDGRVFFLAIDLTLPATPNDINDTPGLFSIHPGQQATVSRVAPRAADKRLRDAKDGLMFFEVSPDEQWISLPCDDGRLLLLSVATGEVSEVQTKPIPKSNGEGGLTSVPVWRTATELTFVQPREDGQGNEVVRYSVTDKKATPISGQWPAAAKEGWLIEKKEAATQAGATQPGAATRGGR